MTVAPFVYRVFIKRINSSRGKDKRNKPLSVYAQSDTDIPDLH